LASATRDSFKDAWRAVMVKRASDLRVYDELFDLYFSGLGQAVRQGAATLMENMQLDAEQFQQLMDRLAEILQNLEVDLSELAQALLQNDTGRLEKMLRDAAEQANAQSIERSYQEGTLSHSTAHRIGL